MQQKISITSAAIPPTMHPAIILPMLVLLRLLGVPICAHTDEIKQKTRKSWEWLGVSVHILGAWLACLSPPFL
ncbi:hypothetical protein BDQ17DRAFT_1370213 [Cyathus striatus]|nr:hypothetical protein BDQ17DRAFT_1370213 [Cyathus striatus]